jgi:GT2 family glycosyltransferase
MPTVTDHRGPAAGRTHEKPPPFISVIVPTYDRAKSLEGCLAALARQDYPGSRFEVLVVDDGSPAPLAPALTRFEDEMDVTFFRQGRAGPAAARNAGAERARGTYLAFIDDDCEPGSGWLSALAAQFAEARGDMLGGATTNATPNNVFADASQQLLDYLYEYFDEHPHEERFFASCNLAVPAERFRSLGGFDARFPLAAAEDRDLCFRWLDRGYRITHVPAAVVQHTHEMRLRGFCRQHFNYGRGAFYYHCGKTERGGPPLKVMPASFYLGILRYPLRSGLRPENLLKAILIGLSQVANAVGFVWEGAVGRIGGRRFQAEENPPTPPPLRSADPPRVERGEGLPSRVAARVNPAPGESADG